MDIITAAIIAALGNLSTQAVGDAYEGLKAKLLRKFGAESDLADAVAKLEQTPNAQWRQDALQEETAEAGADKDAEIIKEAEALLAAIKALPGGEKAIEQIIGQQVIGDENIFSGAGDVT